MIFPVLRSLSFTLVFFFNYSTQKRKCEKVKYKSLKGSTVQEFSRHGKQQNHISHVSRVTRQYGHSRLVHRWFYESTSALPGTARATIKQITDHYCSPHTWRRLRVICDSGSSYKQTFYKMYCWRLCGVSMLKYSCWLTNETKSGWLLYSSDKKAQTALLWIPAFHV